MNKKIPAVRARMGIWIYYVSAMSFEDINEYVKPIDDELHNSKLLRDMIQRSITDNYREIANYLLTQDERFFNALVLAVYNGSPSWKAIRIENEEGDDNYDLGLLSLDDRVKIFPIDGQQRSLDDEVKIFPVDGQHRVAGIKEAIKENPKLKTEKVPVIFLSHSTDEIGMQRTRRLFSTLNRYAKPVSLRDIIALDEDDVVAIVSRNIIDQGNVFTDKQILDSKTKAIPDSNRYALTSIITFYDCNKELLWPLIKNLSIKNSSGNLIRSKAQKTTEFLRHRPSDEFIEKFEQECRYFWVSILKVSEMFQNKDDIGRLRNAQGGHLFCRPLSLYAFTKAVMAINEKKHIGIERIIKSYPEEYLWLDNSLWRRILWDDAQNKMVMGNSELVRLLLINIFDSSVLSPKEKSSMKKKLDSIGVIQQIRT